LDEKWIAIGGHAGGKGFEKGSGPFQDFTMLVRFRNDQVHDKVADLSTALDEKRYQGRFPSDPVSGTLGLEHALSAAKIYWAMVDEAHRLLGMPVKEFARHYELSPWSADSIREPQEKVAVQYARRFRASRAAANNRRRLRIPE
jgi:hypothetical protein